MLMDRLKDTELLLRGEICGLADSHVKNEAYAASLDDGLDKLDARCDRLFRMLSDLIADRFPERFQQVLDRIVNDRDAPADPGADDGAHVQDCADRAGHRAP